MRRVLAGTTVVVLAFVAGWLARSARPAAAERDGLVSPPANLPALPSAHLDRSPGPAHVESDERAIEADVELEAVQAPRAGCRLTGVVLDDHERALDGLELELRESTAARADARWSNGLAALSARASFATLAGGSDGSFRFDGLSPGGWGLFVRGGPDLPRAAYLFRLSADQRAVHLRLVLPRGLYQRGYVLDPRGTPCAGAEVRAAGLDASFHARAHSGSDGRFVLGPLVAGRYRLEASAAESFTVASRIVLVGRVGERELVELRLAPAAVLRVRARDESGAPAAVRLELRGASARSESGSEFHLARLVPGKYELVARTADGRLVVLPDLTLEAGLVPVPLELVVRPGCRLRLRLGGDERRLWHASWKDTLVEQDWLEPGAEADVFLPPGPVSVAWWSAAEEAGGALERQERCVLAAADQAAVFEHAAPR